MATKWTYSATRAGYANMWGSITITGGADDRNATRFAVMIGNGEAQYKAVARVTGVPWYFIGALHMRESSCNFKGVLHNGEHIIGTSNKTRLVPAGRGPFATWSDAAIDALNLKGLSKYKGQWCPSLMGYVSELFNGLGYTGKGVNSAYLWAGSNHEQSGKYVRDHVWDKNFDDPQIGTMTVLKRLVELRPDIAKDMIEKPGMRASTKAAVAFGSTTVVGATAAVVVPTSSPVTDVAVDVATESAGTLEQLAPVLNMVSSFGEHALLIGGVLIVAIVIGAVGYGFYKRRLD